MSTDQMTALRDHLLYLLRGGGTHLDIEKAIVGRRAKSDGSAQGR